MKTELLLRNLLLTFTAVALAAHSHAREMPKDMPREDVIDIPAIGEGLCVSQVFQSNMVLQRDKPITVWGWAKPGEEVKVSFAGNTASATADAEHGWKVELPAQAANATPQAMTIKGDAKTLTLDNILVGDVWILSGQSNMEFPLEKIEDGNLEIASANYPEIRILSVPFKNGVYKVEKSFPRVWSYSSWSNRHFRKGDWDVCTPEIARELSAIGYVFARRIHKASNVPIGVIDTSQGGTTVETWIPKDKLKAVDSADTQAWLKKWEEDMANWDPKEDLEKRIQGKKDWLKKMDTEGRDVPAEGKVIPSDLLPGPIADKNNPGYCFAGMINPLAGLSVKGTIWHQGFNNAFGGLNGAQMYADVFPVLIESWREAFNDPKMPFGILSLCTAGEPQTLDNYCEMMLNFGIGIRAAQYQTFADLYEAGDKNIGFASTYDLRRSWYHPGLKIPAGERIARWALATQYGFDPNSIRWKPPVISDMQAKDGGLIVKFNEAIGDPEDGDMVGFAIAGKDRRFHPVKAEYPEIGRDHRNRPQYDRKQLKLTSIMVPEPVAYRYAWSRNPLANLSYSDVPLATQRSDDWPDQAVPLGVLPENATPLLTQPNLRDLKIALQKMDKQRKLAEAKATIEVLEAGD